MGDMNGVLEPIKDKEIKGRKIPLEWQLIYGYAVLNTCLESS